MISTGDGQGPGDITPRLSGSPLPEGQRELSNDVSGYTMPLRVARDLGGDPRHTPPPRARAGSPPGAPRLRRRATVPHLFGLAPALPRSSTPPLRRKEARAKTPEKQSLPRRRFATSRDADADREISRLIDLLMLA